MSSDNHEVVNGRWCMVGWQAKLDEAQNVLVYTLDGTDYPRVTFGNESDFSGDAESVCIKCAAAVNQYHIPGCAIEECPKCGEKVIRCSCH